MGEERRVFERKTLRGPARIVLRDAQATIVRMLDISLGGAGILSELNLPAKKSFQLEFNILVRKTNTVAGIRAPVVVTHVAFSNNEGGFKVGLQFLSLSDVQKQLINQFIDVKLPKSILDGGAHKISGSPDDEKSENNSFDNDVTKTGSL